MPVRHYGMRHCATPAMRRRPPPIRTSYVLGPEDKITVRVFAADDIPDKPAQIANDGT